MIDALAWFGLRPGASERDVKRAYARRLKDVRPDEDAAAFQELHERYQEALQWVQYVEPAETQDDIGEGSATVVTFGREAEPVEETADDVAADWHAFHDGLLQYIRAGNRKDLHDWLIAQPALWSLDTKGLFGAWVMHSLRLEDAPPMPREMFDLLVEFFDQNDVATPSHTLHLERLRSRLDLAWGLQPGNEGQFKVTREGLHGVRDPGHARRIIDALSRPRSLRTILRFGLSPFGARDMVKFIDGLNGGRRDLPPPIREDQVEFWDRVADTSRLSWGRVGLMFARCAIVAAGLSAIFALVGYPRSVPWVFAIPLGFGAAVLLLTTYGRAYFNWQARHEFDDVRWPALRLAWIPLLVGAGFALESVTGRTAWTYTLVNIAYVTALVRYSRRNGAPPLIYGWMIYLILLVLMWPPAGACITLALWTLDAWFHRRVLKWRRNPSPG